MLKTKVTRFVKNISQENSNVSYTGRVVKEKNKNNLKQKGLLGFGICAVKVHMDYLDGTDFENVWVEPEENLQNLGNIFENVFWVDDSRISVIIYIKDNSNLDSG